MNLMFINKSKINLKELRSAPGQKLHLSFRALLEEQNLTDPAHGNIFLTATPTSVRVTGKIEATAKLSCHRCLSPFLQFMELDLKEEFVYEDYLNVKTSRGKERELQKEDFFETVAYDGTIDVTDIVYQAIVLATPNYCVCGPNCAGPPIYKDTNSAKSLKLGNSHIETRLPVDPRWDNLKTIFSNDAGKKKVSDNS